MQGTARCLVYECAWHGAIAGASLLSRTDLQSIVRAVAGGGEQEEKARIVQLHSKVLISKIHTYVDVFLKKNGEKTVDSSCFSKV